MQHLKLNLNILIKEIYQKNHNHFFVQIYVSSPIFAMHVTAINHW